MPSYCKISLLLLLFALAISGLVRVEFVKAEKEIVVPQDFPTINSAIGNASQGDTILVKNGVYNENLVIDKPLMIVSENKSSIIDGGGKGSVVWIKADNVGISGFTIQNSGSNFTDSGIYLNNSGNVVLSENKVISNNIGIYIYESSKSNLRNNDIGDNKFNFGIYSSNLKGYIQDIDTSNTVNGKPIFFLVNQSVNQSPQNAGYIAIVNCTNIAVTEAFLERNWQNLLLAYTKNSTINKITSTMGMDSIWLIESKNCSILNNNVVDNIWGGIALVNSFNCTFKGNTLRSNGGYGLFLSDSSDNQFYHNNFISNQRQTWLYGDSHNSWDDGYPSGGNFWDNYTGTDEKNGVNQNESGNDDLGDTPFIIDQNNIDNYPLMKNWREQSVEVIQPQLEFSVMSLIALVSVFVIFVAYFVKARMNRKQASKR